MTPFYVVTVHHIPGGTTRYGVALTTNGLDRVEVVKPTYERPKEAQRHAERLQRRVEKS